MSIIFTKHANQRAIERNILKEEVLDCVLNPDSKINQVDKLVHRRKNSRGTIEVILQKKDSNLIVITVYWV